MKTSVRILGLIAIVFFIGCATGGGSSGGDSSGGLSDADFKRMGVTETHGDR